MNLAGAQRLARRLHRGEIGEIGRAYVDHLERVAALVAAEGGDERQQMAAWLHGTRRVGLLPRDLAALGVPGRVIQIVAVLTPRQLWEQAGVRAARVRGCPGAALVLHADVTDLCRPEARAASAGDPRWSNGKHWLAGALSKIAASRRHQADSGWVATLVRLAADRDPFLRATAIRGLAGLTEHEQLIIGALSDPSPQVVDAALGSLSGIGELAEKLTSIAGRLEPEWTWAPPPRRAAARQGQGPTGPGGAGERTGRRRDGPRPRHAQRRGT